MSTKAPFSGTLSATEVKIRDFLASVALQQMDRVRHFVETEGLHPDSTYRGKPTALCYAVLKPCWPLLSYLVARGANVGQADRHGMTPLHYATMGGCIHCIGYLIANGAALNEVDDHGRTALALTRDRTDLAVCREYLLRVGASHEASAPVRASLH